MLNVLVVEDDLMIADLLCEELAHDGYHVTGIARSVAEAQDDINEIANTHRGELSSIGDRYLPQCVRTPIRLMK